ncbi:hypothetical protein EDD22DRAFT_854093 [Suillus occidentalis]|nr:hypothetical protein EDD22DRAFT_854093 [Suillus occidentalis]
MPRCRDNLFTSIGQRRQHTMAFLPAANPPLEFHYHYRLSFISTDDLLNWSPPHSGWVPAASGKGNDSLPSLNESGADLQDLDTLQSDSDHHRDITALPLSDSNYNNVGGWPPQNPPQTDPPHHALPPTNEAPSHLFGLGASHADSPSHILSQTSEPPTHLLDLGVGHAHSPNQSSFNDSSTHMLGLGAIDTTHQYRVSPNTALDCVDVKINHGFRQAGRERLTMPHEPSSSISDAPYRWNPVDLDQWRERTEGLQEVERLKGTVNTILRDFETVAAILSATGDDAFLSGVINLRRSDGQLQPFLVPFAHPTIIRLVEIILVELQYYRRVEKLPHSLLRYWRDIVQVATESILDRLLHRN